MKLKTLSLILACTLMNGVFAAEPASTSPAEQKAAVRGPRVERGAGVIPDIHLDTHDAAQQVRRDKIDQFLVGRNACLQQFVQVVVVSAIHRV